MIKKKKIKGTGFQRESEKERSEKVWAVCGPMEGTGARPEFRLWICHAVVRAGTEDKGFPSPNHGLLTHGGHHPGCPRPTAMGWGWGGSGRWVLSARDIGGIQQMFSFSHSIFPFLFQKASGKNTR